MGDIDINNLLEALDNNNNENIMKLTTSKIQERKNNILQRLHLKKDVLESYQKKLKSYMYIDDLTDLSFGHYIRWISLKNVENIFLTQGAIFCDYKVINDCLQLVCKNRFGKIFQIKFDEIEIFQKISNQEKILLNVLELLEKN